MCCAMLRDLGVELTDVNRFGISACFSLSWDTVGHTLDTVL